MYGSVQAVQNLEIISKFKQNQIRMKSLALYAELLKKQISIRDAYSFDEPMLSLDQLVDVYELEPEKAASPQNDQTDLLIRGSQSVMNSIVLRRNSVMSPSINFDGADQFKSLRNYKELRYEKQMERMRSNSGNRSSIGTYDKTNDKQQKISTSVIPTVQLKLETTQKGGNLDRHSLS